MWTKWCFQSYQGSILIKLPKSNTINARSFQSYQGSILIWMDCLPPPTLRLSILSRFDSNPLHFFPCPWTTALSILSRFDSNLMSKLNIPTNDSFQSYQGSILIPWSCPESRESDFLSILSRFDSNATFSVQITSDSGNFQSYQGSILIMVTAVILLRSDSFQSYQGSILIRQEKTGIPSTYYAFNPIKVRF